MSGSSISSILLSSTDPERLRDWYAEAFAPKVDRTPGEPGYDVLDFNGFYVMLDRRDDVDETNPQPGRMFLNVETDDARSIAQRIDALGGKWHAPLEDRGGSLFATAIDPDGNYVQIIEFSEEARAEMESGMTDSQTT
ncbi:VOC family protein [Rhodococcus qingshengii]|uniref:VOC family protein n=1 Tax=Rhodococcus TaxID=1827 RepID=UPI000717FFB0|nr:MULTISPECIES: VOC family protein [Rhodococcus]MBQ7808218.1 VOC family protein [Rhodococcus sp. (in: high G+C Gram-positive bacteria)]QPG92026.1 VOC family protein [Rhodococcus qingshengii]